MKLSAYTVHAPSGMLQDPEKLVFVREKFSLFAFSFPWLWLIVHRVWRILLIYLLVIFGLIAFLAWTGVSPVASTMTIVLIGLYFGLEAPALRQAALRRRGFTQIASVLAASEKEAEQRYFTLTLAPMPNAMV